MIIMIITTKREIIKEGRRGYKEEEMERQCDIVLYRFISCDRIGRRGCHVMQCDMT
jgi:hypothetical protein